MFQKLWHSCFIKKYLDNLIQSKIDSSIKDFSIKSKYALQKHWKQDYYDLRWKELSEMSHIESVEVFLKSKLKIRLYTDSLLSKFIYFDIFENDEIQFTTRFLKKDDVFIDIGSNIGLFSLHASPIVGKYGKVICFEPSNITFKRLQENITLNNFKNINAINSAVSNTNGQTNLQLASDGYDAWNSLAKPSRGDVLHTETIDCITFDTFMETCTNSQRISLIKIDVEGWEIPVLEGGKDFFMKESAPTVLIEFTDENAINAGYSCKDLYNLLLSYGYTLFSYNANTNELIQEELRSEYPYVNLIATKDVNFVIQRIK